MKKSKIKNKRTNKKRIGFFGVLGLIATGIERLFNRGPIGFFFSDLYTKCNQKWKSGFIYNLFRKRKQKIRERATFAHIYEESLMSKKMLGRSEGVIHSHLRIFGVGMLFFAIAVIGMAMVKYYLYQIEPLEYLIIGGIIVLLSLPLIVSKKELGEALLKGRLTRFIIINVLNLNPTEFERSSVIFEGSYLSAMLFSIALGLITYTLHPLLIIGLVLALILFILTMTYPELGIIFLMIALPFSNAFPYPSIALLILLVFTSCGFLFKLARGKRVARMELIDVFVLAFSILLLFGGIFTFGDLSSFYSAELYFAFLTVYFLIVNMYIGKPSVYRAFKILIVTATIVSIVGIVRGGAVNDSWVDMTQFGDLPGRVSVFLGNPNMLGVYLVLAFPFTLSQMKVSEKKMNKLIYFIASGLIIACIIMTGSRGAWLGLVAAIVVYLVVYNFKNIWLLIATGCTLPLWQYFLPEWILNRFTSIFTLQDTSVQMRLNIWKSVWPMVKDNFFTGIGVGEQAFKFVYDDYALENAKAAVHSHSLFLQILLNIGIVGAIVFLSIIFMYTQKCFVEINRAHKNSKSRAHIIAGFSSICGALVMGLTDNIWYNYRVFFMFWIVLALTVSLIRNNVRERESTRIISNMTSADIEIDC